MTLRQAYEQTGDLTSMWNDGLPVSTIAENLGISESAVRNRSARLGLQKRDIPHKTYEVATPWTDERIDLLKALWAAGLSGSEIAAQLGSTSRNGVIGKVHRLGLTKRVNRTTERREPKPRKRKTTRLIAKPNRRDRLSDSLATPLIDNLAIPDAQRLSLLQLTEDSCHWPVGDPDKPGFFFCGGNADGHSPYCAAHTAIAYRVPPRPARQEPRYRTWMMERTT
jgi:GcrA cell cycle regulator